MRPFRFGAHIPWSQIDHYLELVLGLELAPEIAIKGPEFDALDLTRVQRVADRMARAGIRPTVHAPFFDLNPGALDPLIRKVTYQRLEQALSFSAAIKAHLLVVHPGVDKWRYPNLEQVWLSFALDFFPALVEQAAAADCRIAIENIYEESPDTLIKLVDGIDSAWFGHCFDAGHWHLFGRRPLAQWLLAVLPKLFHMHLHDNHGRADEHLPVGEGNIDFTPLWQQLSIMSILPSITLEAHSADYLKRSLHSVQTAFLVD